MIVFAGFPVIVTDAVFADHLKVERNAIFCGKAAYATFSTWARNLKAPSEDLRAAVRASILTHRSVSVALAP